METEKTFSIIIPTLDRTEAIQNVLADLERLTLIPLEILIIDQTDQAKPSQFSLSNGVSVFWMTQLEKNASRARNQAVSISRGNWLLFLDDDVRFQPDLLTQYSEVLDDLNPDACTGGILGPKDQWSETPEPEKDAKYFKHWQRLSSYRTTLRSMRVESACSANFLVRKQAIYDAGGFDERYPGICEDADLGFRMAKMGKSVWHDPRPAVNHLMVPRGGSRPAAKTWEEKRLSIILPRSFKFHLLLLADCFGWKVAQQFCIVRFIQFSLSYRTYLEKPLFLTSVFRSIVISYSQARLLYKSGPKLPLR